MEAFKIPVFYIWTIGCQMNKAESEQIRDYIIINGCNESKNIKQSDLIIANTCVVRQNAEDKVLGLISFLSGIKKINNNVHIAVTGCFVDSNIEQLYHKFPSVSLFFKPGHINEFKQWFNDTYNLNSCIVSNEKISDFNKNSKRVFNIIPIIQGCDNYCSYCIVPFRRGREKSYDKEIIINNIRNMAQYGTREITLTGQNVNSYGKDLYNSYGLSDLLTDINDIEGLARIRFLTNHPKDMNDKLIHAICNLKKVCKQINLPLQSGNNEILGLMNRQYKREDYYKLVEHIRSAIPDVSLSTDIIVGFPNESEIQFEDTVDMIKNTKFDVVHVAMYSSRKGTLADSKYIDNITPEEKRRRYNIIESIQEIIAGQINNLLMNRIIEVLVEGDKQGKLFGRTASNKLVFFKSTNNLFGELVKVQITKTTAWSMQGEIVK